MEYMGYRLSESGNSVVVNGVRDFDPVHTFECGQCFRWIRQSDGSYTGVAKGKVVNVSFHNDVMKIENTSIPDFINIWYEYFDLGTDYSEIKAGVSRDGIMEKAVRHGYGIRILKQDIWEALISFIISANNRIPMIMKVVSAISKIYGEELDYNGGKFYTFPAVDKLADTTADNLEFCKGGFRCKYIVATSQMVRNGLVNLEGLAVLSADEARSELIKFPGVGNKVADCTLLYSGTKHEVFPTDVWVKRVMEELYFEREASFKEIQNFAGDYFGSLAGFAQQYLFYYARENRIGSR
jgi:N-glycosylase/DNA lyase